MAAHAWAMVAPAATWARIGTVSSSTREGVGTGSGHPSGSLSSPAAPTRTVRRPSGHHSAATRSPAKTPTGRRRESTTRILVTSGVAQLAERGADPNTGRDGDRPRHHPVHREARIEPKLGSGRGCRPHIKQPPCQRGERTSLARSTASAPVAGEAMRVTAAGCHDQRQPARRTIAWTRLERLLLSVFFRNRHSPAEKHEEGK